MAISDKKMKNLLQVVNSYRSKQLRGDFLPTVFVLDPTNICNFDCIMCPTQSIDKDRKGMMDIELFRSIVDQIDESGITLLLYNMGESLLHPNIIEMLEYTSTKTMKVVLSTNASRLNQQMSQAILDAGIDEMILCVDGDSADTYERIRKNGKFNQVVANITNFLKLSENYPSTRSFVQMIAMSHNAHERESFLERWGSLNCTPVITWFDTWAGQLDGAELMSDELCPNGTIPRQACADLWFKMTINWDGQVILCVHDWSYLETIGDLKTQTIKEVWQSEAIVQFRRQHVEKAYSSICSNCREWSRPDEELEYLELTPQQHKLLGYNTPPTHFLKASEIKVK